MSTIIKTLVAVIVFATSIQGFTFGPGRLTTVPQIRASSSLSMMWDTKKLGGKALVEISPPKVHDEEVTSNLFRRTPLGSGMDERSPTILNDEMQEIESASLFRIEKSFRQQALKMTLEGDYIGTASKLQRIASASAFEGILPESLGLGSTKVASMTAGGLYKDWDF